MEKKYNGLIINLRFILILLLCTQYSYTQQSDSLGYDVKNYLPIQLYKFVAVIEEQNVQLRWSTITEVNNFGFSIERKKIENSENVDEWKNIGFVPGSGNSNSPKDYFFEDQDVSTGFYSYRLIQLDNTGDSTFSKPLNVEVKSPEKYQLAQNYPNPFNPVTRIDFELPRRERVTVSIINIIGKEIAILLDEILEPGAHSIELNADKFDLSSGVYLYKLTAGQFAEIKKMTLIK